MKKRSGLLVAVKKDEMEKAKDKGLEKGQPNDVLGKAKQETSTDAQHVPQRWSADDTMLNQDRTRRHLKANDDNRIHKKNMGAIDHADLSPATHSWGNQQSGGARCATDNGKRYTSAKRAPASHVCTQMLWNISHHKKL